jgi:hypothetical protein
MVSANCALMAQLRVNRETCRMNGCAIDSKLSWRTTFGIGSPPAGRPFSFRAMRYATRARTGFCSRSASRFRVPLTE